VTLTLQVCADAARTAGLAVAAVAIGSALARLLVAGRSRIAWAALLAPWIAPTLLVSFAYAPLALQLGAFPGATLALYSLALLLRFVPVATLILSSLPPRQLAADRHAFALHRSSPWQRLRFRIRGSTAAPVIAGCVVFLLAFADFELASLWSVKTWTVRVFAAHAGGLALPESLRLIALPLALQLLVLALLAWSARRVSLGGKWEPLGLIGRRISCGYLGGAALLIALLPASVIFIRSAPGLAILSAHFALGREVLTSLGFALGATLLALGVTRLTAAWPRPRALLLAAPALLGALVLSLLTLALFQLPGWRALYDTPLPLLLTLALLLLPLMLPLQRLRERDEALHIAQTTPPAPALRRLLWDLDGRRRFLAILLPFCVAYFDFTAGSLLAPMALPPVFPRLHNLAHYGQTAVLAALLLTALAAPIAVALPARVWFARWAGRQRD